jgi:glycosyltransferase involved in cell wall biosynthesis
VAPVRILFVNHTGARSGAENAMLRLLEHLPAEHERAVACPAGGPLAATLNERGLTHYDIAGTEVSLALHPVRTARGLAGLARSAVGVRRVARRFGADVIHANSVRAGLIASAARQLGGPPVVVQCHDHLPNDRVGAITRAAIARYAELVVAVSEVTADDFNRGLAEPKAERVYISVDHERFANAEADGAGLRAELGLGAGTWVLAEVAQITPWKGQDTAIRALARVRERHDAHLLLVGDVAFASQRYDNEGFGRSLRALVTELGLEHAVHFLGRRDDVPRLLASIDLLLLPSWDEPFGLVVAEAMAAGTPAFVTVRGGVSDYVEDGVNGRLLPPHDPEPWAEAIASLLDAPETIARMRAETVPTAQRFTDDRYCDEMLEAYARAAA